MKKRLFAGLILVCAVITGSCQSKPVMPQGDSHRNFYEIFVGGFYDSDDDGMGDLRGITEKLDYLNDGKAGRDSLGIDGIWLMPIMPSPSYHKYDVLDYYAIDPEYGAMADFEELIRECEKRGVWVILDLVINHSSSRHFWFEDAVLNWEESPYFGFYQFREAPGSGWHALDNGWYYKGHFGSHMPDLNLDDPVLRDEIEGIMRFWLEKGAAGFRLDAVLHFYENQIDKNTEFLSWLTETARKYNPEAYFVGEVWSDGAIISEHYAGMDSLFNFPFAQAGGHIVNAVRHGEGNRLARHIEAWDTRIKAVNPSAIDAPFLTNHDIARIAGILSSDTRSMKMAAAIYLFMPGSPFIYYGEEIGMTGSGRDENKRQPMVFSVQDSTGRPNPPPYTEQTQNLAAGVDGQLKDRDSLLRFYIDAIQIKNRFPEIARGGVTAVDTGIEAICAYKTAYQDRAVFILHNLSGEDVEISLSGELSGLRLQASLAAGGKKPGASRGTLRLPAYSTAILN